jgi:uncharacterized protein YecT (DUF1311 family)
MQLGGIKAKRDAALCDAGLSLVVNNWVGKVEKIDSNADGKGVLSVSIAPDVVIKTWNNAVSDMMDKTLIEPGTPVFQTASAMKRGQYVTFSGLLYRAKSSGDCLRESSLTLKGKVKEPEFIFKFDQIAAYVPGQGTSALAAVAPAAAPTPAPVAAAPTAPVPEAAPAATEVPAQQVAVATKSVDDAAPAEKTSAMPAAPVPQNPEPEPAAVVAPAAPAAAETARTKPSFDCTKAGSVIEHLICKDEALAKLDLDLAQAYKAAASRENADKAALRTEQLSWLKNGRNKCATPECLSAAYAQRIAALQ